MYWSGPSWSVKLYILNLYRDFISVFGPFTIWYSPFPGQFNSLSPSFARLDVMPGKDGPVFKTLLPEAPEQPHYAVTVSDDKKAENGTCSQDKSDSTKSDCKSTLRSARKMYSFLVVSLLALDNGCSLVFSSPLLDEMLKGANSTPWKDGFDQCIHQSLIGPSVLISAAVGGFCSFLLIGLFGLVPSMVLIAVTYTGGWTMIGVSWFVSSPSLFRGLILTGRVITGLAHGLTTASTSVCLFSINYIIIIN